MLLSSAMTISRIDRSSRFEKDVADPSEDASVEVYKELATYYCGVKREQDCRRRQRSFGRNPQGNTGD